MLSIELKSVIGSLVDQFLNKRDQTEPGRDSDNAMCFSFRTSLSIYRNKGGMTLTFESRRIIHLLYHRNNHSSYVSVFSCSYPSRADEPRKVFKHEITHDSEWRNINFFSNQYFEMAEEVNDKLEASCFDKVAPSAMSNHCNSINMRELFRWVQVEVSKDETDENGYRQKLVIK